MMPPSASLAPLRAPGLATLVVAFLGAGAGAVSGQALADPQVPAGRVRLDFAPSFWSWNSRYGVVGQGGDSAEEEEALGADLTDPVGTTLFPGLLTLQDNLRALTGDGGYSASLGRTQGSITKEITRIDAGISIGVFDWLTVGANVPFIKGRTAVDVAFRPDAASGLGVSPASTQSSEVADLLTRLQAAASWAQGDAAALCKDSAPGCGDATALAERVADFSSRAEAAYAASSFFPTAGSEAGASLSEALASLNGALSAAGIPQVGAGFVFAESPLDADGFASLATNSAAGFRGSALTTVDGLWAMGDVELSTSVRLLRGEVRDSGAARPRLAYSVSGGALVRLGTGTPDDPDVFLDIGSGDGQMDMEGRVDGFLQVGRRLDLRGGFRYGIQNSVVLLRRVAPHEMIFVPRINTRAVEWKPGSYTFLDVSPRYRLTPELSLGVDYRRYHKGADTYELAAPDPEGLPPVDVELLARETEATLQEVALGVRYSTIRSWQKGVPTPPMQMGIRLVRPLAGAGGQVAKATRFEFSLSLFRRFWGEP